MNNKQRLRTIIFMAFVGLLLFACGSGSGDIVLVSGIASEDPDNFIWAFGFEGEEATSPGPTITVRVGETVTITFKNETLREDGTTDSQRHNLIIVSDKDMNSSAMELLWEAQVGGRLNYDEDIKTGESGSITFTPDAVGDYFYLCVSQGHFTKGMWGRFIVLEVEE